MPSVPDVMRRAMLAQGLVDPDEVERLINEKQVIPDDSDEAAFAAGRMPEMPDQPKGQVAAEVDLEQLTMDPPDRTGTRGGFTGSYEQGEAALEGHRPDEVRAVQNAIIGCCKLNGECHADDVAFVQVTERNVVGVAFRALAEAGVIESTGEHRASKLPAAHGRKSYVYRLGPGHAAN